MKMQIEDQTTSQSSDRSEVARWLTGKKPWWVLGVVAATAIYVLLVASRAGEPEGVKPATEERSPPPGPKPSPGGPAAKAVVEVAEHDFGVMDPDSQGSHTFRIRNHGDGPLELKKGPTSCKCALAEVQPATVEPGETGQVRIAWTAVSEKLLFSQVATVLTNDPEQESLAFRIKGEVRPTLGAEPTEIVFSNLYPGEVRTQSLTLFSRVWEAFAVTRVEASRPQLTWTIKPAPPEALAEVKGLSGYLLEVASPAEQSPGYFQETLTLHVSPAGEREPERRYTVVIAGRRVSWLSISGKAAPEVAGVKIGSVPSGEGHTQRLNLVVHDGKRQARIDRVETSPGFLRAVATPARPDRPWCNLYHLDIAVPAGAPLCSYLGVEPGEVRVYADDPTLPVVKVPVSFAVVREEAR